MVFSSYGKSFNFFLYIFSYNLRSCEEDRDRKDETQKKKRTYENRKYLEMGLRSNAIACSF